MEVTLLTIESPRGQADAALKPIGSPTLPSPSPGTPATTNRRSPLVD